MWRRLFVLGFLTVLLILVACGDGADPTPTAVVQPTSAPTDQPTPTSVPTATAVPLPLEAESETDGEDFPPNASFVVIFNQPIDDDSSETPLLIAPFLEGEFDWSADGTELIFTPIEGFKPNKTYTITLDEMVTAVTGEQFDDVPVWEITTATMPKVVKREPNSIRAVDRRLQIALTFSREMDQESVKAAFSVDPITDFDLSWEDNVLWLEAVTPLTPDTRYEFMIDETAVDTNGIPLEKPYSWWLNAPELIAHADWPDEEDAGAPIRFAFNYKMDPDSVAKALQIQPPIMGGLEWNDDYTTATFVPVSRFDLATEYTISFDESIYDSNGDPFIDVPSYSFYTPPPILDRNPTGDNIHPATDIWIMFDRPVDQEATAAAFSLDPAHAGEIRWDETTLIFEPEAGYLEPYTDYTVTLDINARDVNGASLLTEPYGWTFGTGYLQDVANFGYGPNAQIVDGNGRRAIQYVYYQSGDLPIQFALHQLDLVQFLDMYSSGFRGGAGWENNNPPIIVEDTELVTTWQVTPGESLTEYNDVQEVIIPEDVPNGLYILDLRAGHLNDQLILVLTDSTLAVKQAEGQLVSWVTDINGAVLPDVDVAVYARDGELITAGQADENGVFRAQVERNPEPLMVVAQVGNDITISGLTPEWRNGASPWGGWWQNSPTAQDYATYIYTERPIYRPGDPIYFKAIVREDHDALLEIVPEATAVVARLRDARNNVVQTQEFTTNNFGTINGQFQLGDGAMVGEYKIEIEIDGETHSLVFQVQDYRKPDYQVSVLTDKDQYIAGEEITVDIATDYYFGEPVADANIDTKLFMLKQREWWEPGEGTYIWYQNYEDSPRGKTDANGRYAFELEAEAHYNSTKPDWRSNLEESIWAVEATVDDGSHQTVSGFKTIRVYNVAEWIRLDTGSYFHTPGNPFTINAEVGDIYGDSVANRSLTITLRRWNYSDRQYNDIVQSERMTTDANGKAAIPFTINEPGFYRLHAKGTDRLGNEITFGTYTYAFERTSSWQGRYDSNLAVTADKESYAPGDTAQLLIESDFSGPALLTFERGTTRREQLIELTAPVTIAEVDIQADDAPNIFVTVNAWEPEDIGNYTDFWETVPDSRLRTSSVNLSVPVTDKTLIVTITPDKETYAPREEATFTVRVTNQQGVPVSAEVSLAMVDEAIFALATDEAGPIFDAFYFERENIVRTYNSMAPVRYLGGGGMGGGGGDLVGAPRSDFPDTAEWFPVLHTDFNGEVMVQVTLPDSLTSWRLTSKAATADTQVGETYTNITTRQDIVVRPILPRVLTAGDELQISALVHNYSAATQTLDVQLTVGNEQLAMGDGDAVQSITLRAGEVGVVGWPVTAVAAGDVEMTVQARIDDAVMDAVLLPLTIRPLAIPDVVSQVGQLQTQLATTVNFPADALPMSTVNIELSRSIAGTLLEGLEYLTGYPYGCVEQTMSKALPNAVVGRAINQLGVTNPTLQADLPAKINAGLQRLYGYQHNDGGWGWWYDDDTHDYQTAWVVFGLATMREAGYEVDQGVIDRGVDWLNEHLYGMDIRTRAYALYSMAVAGQPNVAESLVLLDQLDELDTFSQAGLALALYEAGERPSALAVLDVLEATAVSDNGKTYWDGDLYDGYYYDKTMASGIRSTALALSAVSQIDPGRGIEGGIVRWLMGQRQQQGWGSTNETSYAIIGLTDHLLATSFSESATATSYTITLNGDVVATGNLGRNEPAISLEITADQLSEGSNDLRITQDGSTPLYYTINSRMYVAQEKIAAAGDVEIERTYLDEAGDEVVTAVAGQLVEVRLVVTMPADASYMIIEDSLPGGLEALNEGLNTTSHVEVGYNEQPYYWQEYGYNNKEVYGDRVSFFITDLSDGRHEYTYYARVTHAGEFVAMPTEAYAMYDATVWGRSASDRFVSIEAE